MPRSKHDAPRTAVRELQLRLQRAGRVLREQANLPTEAAVLALTRMVLCRWDLERRQQLPEATVEAKVLARALEAAEAEYLLPRLGKHAGPLLGPRVSDRIQQQLWRQIAPVSLINVEEDVLALLYAVVASRAHRARTGQYFTPAWLGRLLVQLADPQPGERVFDPACGTGSLLLQAAAHGPRVPAMQGGGCEVDPLLLRLARINLALQGAQGIDLAFGDFLDQPLLVGRHQVDVMLCNLPFGRQLHLRDPLLLKRWALGDGRRATPLEWVGLCWALSGLRPGGRLAAVLPTRWLHGDRGRPLRQALTRHARLCAALNLPGDVFAAQQANVHMSLLILRKCRPDEIRPVRYPVYLAEDDLVAGLASPQRDAAADALVGQYRRWMQTEFG